MFDVIFLSILWSVTFWRKPTFSRFVFPLYLLAICTLEILNAIVFDKDSSLFAPTHQFEAWLTTTVAFLIVEIFFSFCEYGLCILVTSPLYIFTSYMLLNSEESTAIDAQKQLNENLRYFISIDSN